MLLQAVLGARQGSKRKMGRLVSDLRALPAQDEGAVDRIEERRQVSPAVHCHYCGLS